MMRMTQQERVLRNKKQRQLNALKGAAESSASGMKVPRFQILTAAQILDNRRPQVPFGFPEGYKKAAREKTDQDRLL
jgi:hypothetical protein